MNETRNDGPSDEDLLAFVQGKLSGDQATRVQAAIEADDDVAAEAAFMSNLIMTVQDTPLSQSPPSEFGWHKLQNEIEKSDTTQGRGFLSGGWLQYAAAALACICVLQAFALFGGSYGDQSGYQTASSTGSENVLVAGFVDTITEAQMRGLLMDVGATIVDGPTSAGLYSVRIETEDGVANALDVLTNSPLIAVVAEP